MAARPSSSTSATASVRQTKPNARRKKTTATMTATTQQQNSSRTTILNAKTNFHHAGVGGESDTENDGDDENSTIGLNT